MLYGVPSQKSCKTYDAREYLETSSSLMTGRMRSLRDRSLGCACSHCRKRRERRRTEFAAAPARSGSRPR